MVTGKVTKLTNFGVFVELEPGLEGLLHVSELADHKVASPEDVVGVGESIEVTVLRVDPGERKIGLSRKKPQEARAEGTSKPSESSPTPKPEPAGLKGGLGGGGPLFSLGGEAATESSDEDEEGEEADDTEAE